MDIIIAKLFRFCLAVAKNCIFSFTSCNNDSIFICQNSYDHLDDMIGEAGVKRLSRAWRPQLFIHTHLT